jgi:ribosomal protein S18 acetylase RimI-like enzyme
MPVVAVPYTRELLDGVTAVCETILRPLPFGFTVRREEAADWLDGASDRLERDATLVAVAGDRPVGWTRFGSGGPNARTHSWHTAGPGDGVVRALFAEEGWGAERALAQRAVADLRSWGCERMWAFEDDLGPPFYNGGFGRLSVRLAPVLAALTAEGFAVHELEMQLEADLAAVPGGSPDPRLRASSSATPGGEAAVEIAMENGEWVGQCVWAPMSLHSRDPEASRYGYVWWLGIQEEFHGRGYGRWLLLHVLSAMREQGLDRVRLTTAASNTRAQTLYFSVGFRVVDASAVLLSGSGAGR